MLFSSFGQIWNQQVNFLRAWLAGLSSSGRKWCLSSVVLDTSRSSLFFWPCPTLFWVNSTMFVCFQGRRKRTDAAESFHFSLMDGLVCFRPPNVFSVVWTSWWSPVPVLVTTTRFLSWIVAILFPFDRQPEGARTRKHNQLDTLELSRSLLVPRSRKKTLAHPKILAWKMIF